MKTKAVYYLAAAGLFIAGIASAATAYPSVRQFVPKVFEEVFKGVVEPESKFGTALNIAARNAAATLLLALTGLLVVGPVLITYANGFMVGLGIEYALEKGLDYATILKGTLPHGVFELAAFFAAAAAGLEIGHCTLKKISGDKTTNIKQKLNETLRLYVKIILPLVLIAGFVESYVTAKIIGVTF